MTALPNWFPKFAKKIPSVQAVTENLQSGQQDVDAKAQTIKDAASSVHALVIGIDDYDHQKKLSGAVADADAFTEYLTKDLGIPSKNIVSLRDKQATRQGIIDAMIGLSTNSDIVKDTPIIIYYSGHGGEIPAPADRSDYGDVIQCLLPQDVGKSDKGVEVVKGAAPIPDFTVGALLENIAHEKGNNITVIFDCCHSAGGSRAEEAARVVNKENIPPLPNNLDVPTLTRLSESSQGLAEANGFIGQAMRSHVLIAACAHVEQAYEDPKLNRGYFTMALLERLRQVNIDSITYQGLMKRIGKLPATHPQNPVCEGENIDRILFNGNLSSFNNSFLPVALEPVTDVTTGVAVAGEKANQLMGYYIKAGSAQGISPGSTYRIYDSDKPESNNEPPHELVVVDVQPFRSLLTTPSFDMPKYPCARQVGYGSQEALGVYCTPEFLEAMTDDQKWNDMFVSAGDGFVLHPVEEPLAHVVVGVTTEEGKKRATFRIKEQAAIKYGIDTLPHTVAFEADHIVPVLRSIARWSWHLRRNPVRRPLESKVKLEFLQLKPREQRDERGLVVWTPIPEDLNKDGVANIIVDKVGNYYGLKITNNCGRDLYAYTVYFSIRDQSTSLRYTKVSPNATGFVDPSLPKGDPDSKAENKGNVLTVGYGSGGTKPIRHFLLPETKTDVGIYKVFMSTEHANFGPLELLSPFSPLGLQKGRDMDAGNNAASLPDLPFWDTLYLTVVQRHSLPEGLQESKEYSEMNPLLKRESSTTVSVACREPDVTERSELFVVPLSEETLSKAKAMRLRTLSRRVVDKDADEGRTWFRISLLKPGSKKSPPYIDSHENQPGDSNENQLGDSDENNLVKSSIAIDGQVIGREHRIWTEAAAGDSFRVHAMATGMGWTNHVDEAAVRIW